MGTFAIWTGVLTIVGFAVGISSAILLPAIRDRIAGEKGGLSANQEIELRKLLVLPFHDDGSQMTAIEISDRICQILDIDLVVPVVPPAAAEHD